MLRAANVARVARRSSDALRTSALAVQGRTNHNKTAYALVNKMARICYATRSDGEPYGQSGRLNRKLNAWPLPCRLEPNPCTVHRRE